MTRAKKRWIVVAVLALLVVAGAFIAFQMSPRGALRRAEAFLFRRMQVTRLDDGAFRFYYVTNRGPGEEDGALERRFGNQRVEELHFGSYDAAIEPTLGLSDLFDPSKWFRNEEVEIREERELGERRFVRDLQAVTAKAPLRSLLIIVHGYREQFPSALRKTAFVSHVLDLDTPVLLFDWPGDQPGGPVASYRRAVEVAEASGHELARTLELVIREVRPQRLWLLANSMGGQVVADAFHLLYQQADLAGSEAEIENVVLTAPDVSLGRFNSQFKKEIGALTENLTVYVSSNDRALLASRIVNRERRRGESTLDSRDVTQEMLDEAIRVAALVEPDSELVTLIDVTPVNRTINFHNFYLESPEVFNDLFLRLVNREPPSSRVLYPIQNREGSIYWVLTRGR